MDDRLSALSVTATRLSWSPQWRRVVVVNASKFLGNLLIGGGLLQAFFHWCREREVQPAMVLDARYRDLLRDRFPGVELIWYPRQAIEAGSRVEALGLWWRCLRQIRAFRADLAFAIEEDSVCHQLTLLSGAGCRVSSTRERHAFGFHHVLPVERVKRPAAQAHMWYSYAEVLARLGVELPLHPAYLEPGSGEDSGLDGLAVDRPLILLHAGATKAYKRWPLQHYAELAQCLLERGYALGLIGAGPVDRQANREIQAHCREQRGGDVAVLDFCDRLSLPALLALMRRASLIIGNDSGPMHLAAACGLPGVVLFGPTDRQIWGPLSDRTVVLEKPDLCADDCRRRHCRYQWRCLSAITPDEVMANLPVL